MRSSEGSTRSGASSSGASRSGYDFFCVDAQLAVEADGASHFPTPPEDVARDALLATSGVLVLRFSNDEILTDPERVLRAIEKHVRARRQYGRP